MNKEGTKQIYGILKSNSAVYNLSKSRISIGRSKASIIVINHPSVSKDHAIIEFDSEQIPSIKDLNSSNGTYVNGQRLQSFPITLKTNDKISFGKDPNEYIFESFNQENEKTVVYPTIVHDGKISLVNENAYQSPKINHFRNKNNFYMNQQIQLPQQAQAPFNNQDNFNFDSPNFYRDTTENNNENNDTNANNNEVTFKNKNEELNKKITTLTKEKEELNKKITELEESINSKGTENKKINDLFDQLTEEYSKLNSKHNTLMIYASDLQKKVDILELELQDCKSNEQNKDFAKILSEKDNIITILQNELNFYKDQLQKGKGQFNIQGNPQSPYPNPYIQDTSFIAKKIDDLSENYIKENKKLREKIEKLEKKTQNTINNSNYLKNNNNNFEEFENQLNLQITNFNQIITDYNNKLSDAINKIPIMFENDKKEDAAKYLVEQVNDFMSENQKLIAENSKLNLQISQLQNEIINLKSNQYLPLSTGQNIDNNINKENYRKEDDKEKIDQLQQKVEELENLITKANFNTNNEFYNSSNRYLQNTGFSTGTIPNYNNYNNSVNNNENEMKECLINAINELREKEKTIDELKNKLKDTINKTTMNFDERQIVNSVSQVLREKENLIQNLQNQINSSKISPNENKFEEIKMNKNNFISSVN